MSKPAPSPERTTQFTEGKMRAVNEACHFGKSQQVSLERFGAYLGFLKQGHECSWEPRRSARQSQESHTSRARGWNPFPWNVSPVSGHTGFIHSSWLVTTPETEPVNPTWSQDALSCIS